jgi:hypothetical protein
MNHVRAAVYGSKVYTTRFLRHSKIGQRNMRIPVIKGIIERRILANYRVDPEPIARMLPKPFRPQLVKDIRCRYLSHSVSRAYAQVLAFPYWIGSENAAHRIAESNTMASRIREFIYASQFKLHAERTRGRYCVSWRTSFS